MAFVAVQMFFSSAEFAVTGASSNVDKFGRKGMLGNSFLHKGI